jgi:DNA mismatch repair protein MutS2
VIDRARSLLGPESREAADLIAYLHRSRDEIDRMQQQMAQDRQALEEERRKLRADWVERQQRRIKDLEANFTEMQKRFDENVAGVLAAVKDRELRAQLERSSRRKMQDARGEARDELNAAVVRTLSESQADLGIAGESVAPLSSDRLQPGAKIRVRGFTLPVVLRRIEGSTAEIEAGPLRMKVAVDQITAVESSPAGSASAQPTLPGQNVRVTRPVEAAATDEINVIGSTVEEATDRVDKFLDQAALANLERVRIIHGHGTGALRKGLARFLSSHPLAGVVRAETEDRGGKAITIVELRR